MADYKMLDARECAERILNIEHPLVVMHVRPDGDTVGSCSALLYIFHKLGKAPLWACSDPIPERLEFLLKDYREAYPYEYTSSTVVTVDIPTKEQIGDIYDFLPQPALMIDHHEVGTPFADNFTLCTASSAGEVVMLVAAELVAIHIEVIEQTCKVVLCFAAFRTIFNMSKDTLKGFVQVLIGCCLCSDITEQFARKNEESLFLNQTCSCFFCFGIRHFGVVE